MFVSVLNSNLFFFFSLKGLIVHVYLVQFGNKAWVGWACTEFAYLIIYSAVFHVDAGLKKHVNSKAIFYQRLVTFSSSCTLVMPSRSLICTRNLRFLPCRVVAKNKINTQNYLSWDSSCLLSSFQHYLCRKLAHRDLRNVCGSLQTLYDSDG